MAATASVTSLPSLLPRVASPASASDSKHPEWIPRAYLQPPRPPPPDEAKQHEMEMAMARQAMDGKPPKKIRPRRTVDYGGSMGRYILLRKLRPSPTYVPYIRPCPPAIIDLLPPKAYANNCSTSLLTRFVHTSTNKIRCPVNVVLWTPEGRRVLTGSQSGEFTLWNGLTFNFETILQAHDGPIRAMRFTHSGAYLASADQQGIIKYFQPNMNNLNAWQGHREAVRGLSFSPDDARFATASDDSTVRIWAFEESREERTLTGHGWDVKCVEWHHTKGLLASGSKDNLVKFWDPRTSTCLSTLHYHKNTIQALAWSPNGNLLASASRDQTCRVFDIRAMKEFRVLKGHKKEVCSLAWHPIHPILVSGGSEGSLLHWDLSGPDPSGPSVQSSASLSLASTPVTPTPRAELAEAHDSNVWSLEYHPLGHLLASASNDHTTRFWCRERPGDSGAAGGMKPPVVVDTSQQEAEDEEFLPGLGGPSSGMGDDFIPGFSDGPPSASAPSFPRQGGPLPSQQDMYGNGGPPQDEWSGGGRGGRGGGRQSRWGPKRGHGH